MSSHAHHFLYRTVNSLTGQYYIGLHSTNKIDDGYKGSGLKLKNAFAKYGRENFKTLVLEVFSTREALILREAEIVSSELLKDPLCMNLICGGSTIKIGIYRTEAHAKAISDGKINSGYKHSEQTRKNISSGRKGIKISEEGKTNHRAAMNRPDVKAKTSAPHFGRIPGCAKTVIVNGQSFPSITHAQKGTGLSYKQVHKLGQFI